MVVETGEGHCHSPCPAGDQRGFLSNICSSLMATGTLHLFLPFSGCRQPLKPSEQRALLMVVTGTASPYLQNTSWPTRFLPCLICGRKLGLLLRTNAGASEAAATPTAKLEAFLQTPRNAFFKASGVRDITPNENFSKVQCPAHWRTSRVG